MLIFNEGLPGGGKSYDSMVTHILPALKRRRKVFARLNGLADEGIRGRIAAYCGLSTDELNGLLFHVSSLQVKARFVASVDAEGELVMPPEFVDALIVIDEVHEFYGQDTKNKLSQEVEQFFAIHRHYGMDIVIMSQWYKRLSTVLRARVERKYVFQKLTALGLESMYTKTEFQALAPDRYVKKGVEKKRYDPEIFALYRGVVSDEINTEVYKAGSATIWKKLGPMILIAAIVLGVAGWMYTGFFRGKSKSVTHQTAVPANGVFQPESIDALASQHAAQPVPQQSHVAQAAAAAQSVVKPDVTANMTPSQRYVWKLFDKGRARVIGRISDGRRDMAWIEWRQETADPYEQLSVDQLRAMGVECDIEPYGVKLTAGKEVLIATAWPVRAPVRPDDNTLYQLPAGAPGASEASVGAPAGSYGGSEQASSAASVATGNTMYQGTIVPSTLPSMRKGQ